MEPDDRICYCYDVSLRKLTNYARRHRLRRPSQISECLGAGTGCGWCIPILERIVETAQSDGAEEIVVDTTPEAYARQRKTYIERKEPKNRF